MNIGTITYKNYDERVLLNWNFNSLELFNIILNDKDFVRFEIFDRNNNLLLSTHYPNVEQKGIYVEVVKIKKETEIKTETKSIRSSREFYQLKTYLLHSEKN